MRKSSFFYLVLSLTQFVLFLFFGAAPSVAAEYLLPNHPITSTTLTLLQFISVYHSFLLFFSFFMTTVLDHRARNSFHLALSILFLGSSIFLTYKTYLREFSVWGYALAKYNSIFFLIFFVLWIKKEDPFQTLKRD
jgi:hypothetical protein